MTSRSAVVARHEAAERLTYAAVARDRDGVREAYALLRKADSLDGAEPDDRARQAVIENDPITAASIGWLTFQGLAGIVAEDPERYLLPDEAAAYAERGEPVLRVVVRARLDGVSFAQAEKPFAGARRGQYKLAARGRVSDPKKLQQLLRDEKLDADDDGE